MLVMMGGNGEAFGEGGRWRFRRMSVWFPLPRNLNDMEVFKGRVGGMAKHGFLYGIPPPSKSSALHRNLRQWDPHIYNRWVGHDSCTILSKLIIADGRNALEWLSRFLLRMPHLGAFHPSFRVGGVYLRHNFVAIKSIHVEATSTLFHFPSLAMPFDSWFPKTTNERMSDFDTGIKCYCHSPSIHSLPSKQKVVHVKNKNKMKSHHSGGYLAPPFIYIEGWSLRF